MSNRVSRRQAGRWASEDQFAPPEEGAEQAPAPQAAVPELGDPLDGKLAQLKSLGELTLQGVVSDAEFETQKQKNLQS